MNGSWCSSVCDVGTAVAAIFSERSLCSFDNCSAAAVEASRPTVVTEVDRAALEVEGSVNFIRFSTLKKFEET